MHTSRLLAASALLLSAVATSAPAVAAAQAAATRPTARPGTAAAPTSPAATSSQPAAERPDTARVIAPQAWMLSVNPLGLLYGGLTGEAERRLTRKHTAAAALNYWSAYGANYTSVDLKYRIYQDPADHFRGLSYGPMVGFQRIGLIVCDVGFGEPCGTTGITVGGTVDYVLPFGEDERWTAALGGGVKTSIGTSELAGVQFTYPFIRVGVGYTFPRK